ncbi:MAG: hypothetical protein JOY62_02230 [Acidobacteriaceae bacterium]|nr:hypothetical protein [Acidobacteriaceae bacterium]MBV9778766.1 hypothetical protein [Acidobacteriaceae bacterium]
MKTEHAYGRLYLGIDGGQSSTTALIAGETGRVIGRGWGGPCNHISGAEGKKRFRDAVSTCVSQACLEAGVDANNVTFASACLGFSGGPDDKEKYSRELIRSRQYKITHDAEIALSGATAGDPGVIIIAGTGSMAFGRNAEQQTARAGGWGYIFGDDGGAFDIVRRALRAALQYEEGWGQATVLRDLLLKEIGVQTANKLLHLFYTPEYPRSRVASFCPLVMQAAGKGDAPARAIIERAAANLSRLVEGVYRQLFPSPASVLVSYIGGVFQSALLLEAFMSSVHRSIACEPIPPRFDPAAGALLEAFRMDGRAGVQLTRS